jgi:hypothetical protein
VDIAPEENNQAVSMISIMQKYLVLAAGGKIAVALNDVQLILTRSRTSGR